MKEIWLPIEGYEGLYEVSNFGNVRSLNYNHTGERKVLSPGEICGGYLKVCLCKNGKRKMFFIHRLVAETFLPNLFGDPQVNHKDENKHNNHVDNLEWCTAKYNCNHGNRNQRSAKSRSKTVLQLTKAGELVREWPSTAEAGRNGFHQSAIVNCCRGERQSHKGFVWKYKEFS